MKSEREFRESVSVLGKYNYEELTKERKMQETDKEIKVSIFGRAKYGKKRWKWKIKLSGKYQENKKYLLYGAGKISVNKFKRRKQNGNETF